MIARILRSLMTLGALVVAYQAYALLAVPWLEPPINFREQRKTSSADRASANPVTKYQRLLAHYFPKGHWTLVGTPMVIGSRQVIFVLDGYEHHENARTDVDGDGEAESRVDIARCALVLFPTPYQEGITPPGDAVIVEAPQRATLQFKGFRPERLEIGELTRGEFPGKITIRSGMRSPGPEDDLLVETANLMMNSKLLYTSSPVRFRMGANVGGGRELEVRFLEDEHARPEGGLAISGVASLEVRREVRLRLQLEADGLLPGANREDGAEGEVPPRGEAAAYDVARGGETGLRRLPEPAGARGMQTSMEVSCSGPFHFDFVRYVASFDRDVELRQVNANGPSDQLSAQQLDIHFSPVDASGERVMAYSTDAAKRQKEELGRLQATTVVAQGHPVVVVSPSRAAEARGEKIQIGLIDKRVILEGGQDVRLVYGPNVLRAPSIDYQHPAALAGTRLGNFRAGGPGTLQYVLDPSKPDELFTAAWETSVAMAREGDQSVITLAGRPQLGVGAMGRITANEMRVYLREAAGAGEAASALSLSGQQGATGGKLAVLIERMTAMGDVQIESPQLSARTSRLEANVRYRSPADSKSDGSPYEVSSAAEGPGAASAGERFSFGGAGGTPSQTYFLETDELKLDVAMEGQRALPQSILCRGNVVFREVSLGSAPEQAMEVRGDELLGTNLAIAPRVTIRGGAPEYSTDKTAAQLSARGVRVVAEQVEFDEGENRLWIDGPGTATMSVARDLTGRATATPVPLELRWQGGLNFDGSAVVFDRDVLVEASEGWLRCDRLSARLTMPVKFGDRIDAGAIDVGEIECTGQVVLDHRTRDEGGPVSHQRMQLPRLVLNQRTGAIEGDGPGIVRSTHFGTALESQVAGDRNRAASEGAGEPFAQSRAEESRPRLHFLRVDFQRGLIGNLYTRELTFQQRVRVVYGPVDAWEQELSLTQSETLPAGSVQLACDELRINEDPIAAQMATNTSGLSGIGPVQLTALHNVRIEGQSTGQGTFGATADRASYEQAKEKFILEGNARTPATLWQRRFPGDRPTPNEANKIEYDRLTGKVKVYGIRSFEFSPPPSSNLQNAASGALPLR